MDLDTEIHNPWVCDDTRWGLNTGLSIAGSLEGRNHYAQFATGISTELATGQFNASSSA